VPVTAGGKLAPGWTGPVAVTGCKNFDWEDLALDDRGNLIIADVGNNSGRRKQLMLHFTPEPRPGVRSVVPTRSLRVHYADQKEASPDYDCEAVFSAGGKIYFLTKHRSDKRTRLYRLESESTSRSNPLRLVDSFEIGGMVTAADVSPDGKLVAVLTYTSLWVFEFDPASGNIFRRGMRWTPVFAWQAEAAAFDGNNSVVIANESGQLYRVSVDSMEKVR
jgi:roadblock/LC7 domain-containing protein